MQLAALLAADSGDQSVNILSPNLTLVIEVVAFLVLLALLSKFVYPPIIATADLRQREIDAAHRDAEADRLEIVALGQQVEQLLDVAREEARQEVGAAQRQSAKVAESARREGRQRAEAEVRHARQEIRVERERASAELRQDVVTLATAVVSSLGGKALDSKAVRQAVDEAVR